MAWKQLVGVSRQQDVNSPGSQSNHKGVALYSVADIVIMYVNRIDEKSKKQKVPNNPPSKHPWTIPASMGLLIALIYMP